MNQPSSPINGMPINSMQVGNMKTMMQGNASQKGFTLMELMIVVAIIAIISAISYPSYQASVRKTNRGEGMAALMEVAQRLERCYTVDGRYDNVTSCPDATVNPAGGVTPRGMYTITMARAAKTYTLTATPLAAEQVKDTLCGSFTVDNTGKKAATGTTPTKCW